MNNPVWRLPAPAKLNLFLRITGRREDGYHNLETLFQLLDWGDQLEFSPSGRLEFIQKPAAKFPDEHNLVVRAAQLLRQECGVTGAGVKIRLLKKTPTGAGLGGGSSDAATTLLALNALWELHLDEPHLAAIALRLGADVPLFVTGHSALATGVGEQLVPVELPQHWFLVVVPRTGVSTAEIFSHADLRRDSSPLLDAASGGVLTRESPASKIHALADLAGQNDCQKVVEMLYRDVAATRRSLEPFGPVAMSGTGSSLFVKFHSKELAERALVRWLGTGTEHQIAFVAQGLNQTGVRTEVGRLSGL